MRFTEFVALSPNTRVEILRVLPPKSMETLILSCRSTDDLAILRDVLDGCDNTSYAALIANYKRAFEIDQERADEAEAELSQMRERDSDHDND